MGRLPLEREMMEPVKLTIFYAWQSKLDPKVTRQVIGNALEVARKAAGSASNIEMTIDRATRGEPGSPGIADTILEKIRASDLVVADVTPGLCQAPGGDDHSASNPNVCVEVGYAASVLGWSRIILCSNTAFGSTEQAVPFDLRHRKVNEFFLPPTGADGTPSPLSSRKAKKEARHTLAEVVCETAKLVASGKAPKPVDVFDDPHAPLRREQDLQQLQHLFRWIHPPTVRFFADKLYFARFDRVGGWLCEGVLIACDDPGFHLHDAELSVAVERYRVACNRCTSDTAHMDEVVRNNPRLLFYQRRGGQPDAKVREIDEQHAEAATDLGEALKTLLHLVKHRDPTVDWDSLGAEEAQRRFDEVQKAHPAVRKGSDAPERWFRWIRSRWGSKA